MYVYSLLRQQWYAERLTVFYFKMHEHAAGYDKASAHDNSVADVGI